MSSPGPIGVLDSGVGGLSILQHIHHLLPHEDLLYVADSAHAPYGWKSEDFIRRRCRHIVDFFLSRRARAVVLACNTATAAAVAMLRRQYEVPIIGMEPAVKPAAARSRSGVVGVLATAGTIDSEKFLTLASRFAATVEIITRACPGLVEQIERPRPDPGGLDALLREFVPPLVTKGADTLVLGCTHYSLIQPAIAGVAGPAVQVMDTGDAVARELRRRLEQTEPAADPARRGTVQFFTSGDPVLQGPLISRYWGDSVTVRLLPAQEQLV